ncbi:hypothetical protein, partial [Actinomadura bangladeshensis]
IDRPDGAPLAWTRRAERVAAVVAARHGGDRAYALAVHQGEGFSRLLASGQLSMQLIHATGRGPVRRRT